MLRRWGPSGVQPDSRARRRWSRTGVILAVAGGLTIALIVDVLRLGGVDLWLGRHGVQPPYAALGRLVDVGDASLYLDCRGSGSPTVVLESGLGTGAEGWGVVLPRLAAATRTCAYDRLGRGRSDAGARRDFAASAADLRALLAAAGERGPYVVVGHSLGADVARVFAARNRGASNGVVGLVLVDGFDPDVFEDHVLPLLGPFGPEYRERQDGLWALVTRVEGFAREASGAELRVADVAGLPIEVLLAPRAEPRLDDATNERIAGARLAAYRALSPGLVTVTSAEGSGHNIQLERPDLVLAATLRLVDAARADGRSGA